jgi:hypothetical protein
VVIASHVRVLFLQSAALLSSQHDASLIIPEFATVEHCELGSVAVEELSDSVEQCGPLVTVEDRGADVGVDLIAGPTCPFRRRAACA